MSETLPPLTSEWLKNPDSGMPNIFQSMIHMGKRDQYSLRKAVENLHEGNPNTDKPPKVIFITATSSVPYVFAMRTAWCMAFDEPPPKFFTIDVSRRRFGRNHNSRPRQSRLELTLIEQKDIARLQRLGKLYDAFDESALFDEYNKSGATLSHAQELLENAGYRNLIVMAGIWGSTAPQTAIPESLRPIIRTQIPKTGPIDRKLVIHVTDQSRAVVADMKAIGIEMGLEIRRRKSPDSTGS